MGQKIVCHFHQSLLAQVALTKSKRMNIFSDTSQKSHLKTSRISILYHYRAELGCLSRKEIIESVNQSLRNLGLEYIDLLIIHKNDPNCPLEGTSSYLIKE